MATSLALPRTWSALLGLGYIRSLIERRKFTHTCPDCGAEVSPNFKTLKRTGHHRARVFYARLALERRLMELYARLPAEVRNVRTWQMQYRITAMGKHGILSKALTRRAGKRWTQSSKICHGAPCDLTTANRIVLTTNQLLNDMHDRKLLAVEGGVA